MAPWRLDRGERRLTTVAAGARVARGSTANSPATRGFGQFSGTLIGCPDRPPPPGGDRGPAQTDERNITLQILVRDNNVDQALKVLKKKLQREGVFRELKRQRYYEKPSERKAREKGEAVRRGRKAARKLAQREGLLPMPKKKPRPTAGRARA